MNIKIKFLFFYYLATSCLDQALENVNNEILRLDSSMEKAGKIFLEKINSSIIIIIILFS